MKALHAIEEESANPDATNWRRSGLSESEVSAGPLLHKCGEEGTAEAETEAEEPQDIHMDGITWGPKRVICRRRGGEGYAIGDCSKLLCSLPKKLCGIRAGIRSK
jgi:hypothetical protein